MAPPFLRVGQFYALKSNKRKFKLMWLYYGCEQDFILCEAGNSMQKEIEGMRAEMSVKINEMIVALITLKIKYQTRTFVRNQPMVEQEVKRDEA